MSLLDWALNRKSRAELEEGLKKHQVLLTRALLEIARLKEDVWISEMDKLRILRKAVSAAKYADAIIEAPKVASPYKILKVSRYSSTVEIKRAFRQEVVKWHPDKVAHLDVSLSHIKKLVEGKFHEINVAYQQLTGG